MPDIITLAADGEFLTRTGTTIDGKTPAEARTALDVYTKAETDTAIGNATSVMFIPPAAFAVSLGSPTRGAALIGSRFDGWTLPDHATNQQQVVGHTFIPANWATFAVDILWANLSTATGNVVFSMVTQQVSAGTSLTAGTVAAGSSNVTTAAAQDVLNVYSNAVSGVANNGDMMGLRVRREAPHASDTLAGSIGFFGLNLRKMS